MSHEIVSVDPTEAFFDMEPNSPTSQFTRCVPWQEQEQYVWDGNPYDSEGIPETLASSGIQKFLRVANLVESEEPCVAYTCRFHTFEEAHRIDPTSTGRGVRHFKTSLLEKLEKDQAKFTETERIGKRHDVWELKRVYHGYKEYIIRHGPTFNLDDSQREKLLNAHEIASVLYEILKKVDTTSTQDKETSDELLNKVILLEKKIEEIYLKLKDVDFWTNMMQNLFPNQVTPSMKAKTNRRQQA